MTENPDGLEEGVDPAPGWAKRKSFPLGLREVTCFPSYFAVAEKSWTEFHDCSLLFVFVWDVLDSLR